MMHDANDEYLSFVRSIEDAVTSLHKATNALTKLRLQCPCQRMFPQQIERRAETEEIGISRVGVELIDAEFTNFLKVGASR